MTLVQQLAEFVANAGYAGLSAEARDQLKLRLLDALGCAVGAMDGEPVRMVREQVEAFGGAELCTLIGGGRAAPDRAALYNGALVRYLDFNDSYLAAGETCHPSDNLGAVLAAAENRDVDGESFLAALAVAYQVQCRLSDVAPVRERGFDHTVQGSYSVAAGVSRALGLDPERTAHAIAIAGTACNALRVTRTGALSHWKGLAFPFTAFSATQATFLAAHGVTGPPEIFEGNKGFMESIAGAFEIDWKTENLERVRRTIVKRFNAEIHSQATVEGALELKEKHGLDPDRIESIEIDTFDVAYHIIGGGEEGEKTTVRNKEEADHSLPYLVAVALLDGELLPEQYRRERIESEDVQELLRRVTIREEPDYSRRFPEEMPCRVRIRMEEGETYTVEKRDYQGFHTRPDTWESAGEKFRRLSADRLDAGLRRELLEAIRSLEALRFAS